MKRRMFVAAAGVATGAAAGAAVGAERNARAAAAPALLADGSSYYIGPWAGRPDARNVRGNTEIQVTDVPPGTVTRWFSDGSNWRPINGSVVLYSQGKGYSNPLGSVTWASAVVTIAIPGGGIKIPAGMIAPGLSELRVSVLWACGANTGGMAAQMTVGITNSWNDSQCSGAFLGANNEWDQVASFTFPTSKTMSQASSLTPKNGEPVGALGTDYTINVDTDADMFINFGSTVGTTNGNVLKVVRAMVQLFL